MKKMKTLLAAVMALSLCMSLLPMSAFAANAKKGCGIHEGCICGEHLIDMPGSHGETKQCSSCGCIWTHKGNGESSEGNGGAEWKDPVECPHKDPGTGASWLTEKVITDRGCERIGEKKVSCTHCSYEKTETIPALGHDYTGTAWADDCGVTCNHSQSGNHIKACQRSDDLCTDPHNSQTEAHSYQAIAADEGWIDYTGSDHGQTYDPDTQKVQQRTHQCIGCTHNWVEYRVVSLETEPSPVTYTLTVSHVYLNADGTQNMEMSTSTTTYGHKEGDSYTTSANEAVGYTVTVSGTASGTFGTEDITVTYTYQPSVEEAEAHTLTVVYTGLPANLAIASTTATVAYGAAVTVDIPAVAGYTGAARGTVPATMPDEDLTVYVDYAANASGTYQLYVSYVFEDGTTAASPYYGTLSAGDVYSVASPASITRDGVTYSPSQRMVSGIMGPSDASFTVTYSADEVIIDEPDTPLVEEPDLPEEPEPQPEEPIEIDEPDVPLAEEPEIEIEEPGVPLADVPETGDNSHIWGLTALVSAAGLALLTLKDRKRKADAE